MAEYNLLTAATGVKANRLNFSFYQGDNDNLIYNVASDERFIACNQKREAEFGVKLNIQSEITQGLNEVKTI